VPARLGTDSASAGDSSTHTHTRIIGAAVWRLADAKRADRLLMVLVFRRPPSFPGFTKSL
jgi:hypothetical protein